MTRFAMAVLVTIAALAAGADLIAPYRPDRQFRDHVFAPPMPPRIVDAEGRLRWPFFHPLRLVDPIERRYQADTSRTIALVFFEGGRLVAPADDRDGPWLPLGADSLGRDIFSRLLYGARASLGIAALATAGAILIGVLAGALAASAGPFVDGVLMRIAELVLVLPVLYIVLASRAALPLVVPAPTLFVVLAFVLALVGWPQLARSVRVLLRAELAADYVAAARAAGAGRLRVLRVHALPAARGLVATWAVLLVPGFVLAEAALSFAGLGFTPPAVSWGVMLQEAGNVNDLAAFPWILAPAAAIVLVTMCVNAIAGERGEPL